MIGIEIVVRQIFDGYFAALLPAFGLTDADVAWYNVNYQPNPTKVYVRPRLSLGGNDTITLGLQGYIREYGLYQIDVLGIQNIGVKEIEVLAAMIQAEFPAGSRLHRQGVKVNIQKTYRSTPGMDGFRPVIPITISWYADHIKQPPREVLV